MAGSIGVTADSTGRYTEFTRSLANLSRPVNTPIHFAIGSDRSRGRNQLVETALEIGSEWILFLDDDHSFPYTLLQQLLSHEQPVVASLYLQRGDPFLPIAYTHREGDSYWPLDLSLCHGHGLVPVVGAGAGGMLVRSEVFYDMEPPWFRYTTEQSEDLHFCDRCIEAGFPIFVDLDARLGHIAAVNVYPDFQEEGEVWTAGVAISSSARALFPIQMPLPDPAPEFRNEETEV
jgi:hypothetical protein